MKISLCVVARNEEAFLGACLESARPVVDEMVVVDTGSTDSTPAIARRAGARLVRAPWPGDLGGAHNLPLDHARGDWILSLDADEVLDPSSRHCLPDLIRAPGVDGYRLPIRNYTYEPMTKLRRADPTDLLTRGALAYVPTSPVRLFRHRRRTRFSGQLHQTPGPSILAQGGRIETAAVVIHHHGWLRPDRVKTTLYRILARRQLAATPADPRAWIDLGLLFSAPRELPGALAAFGHARALGRRAEAAFFMGLALLETDRPRLAVAVLRESIRVNEEDDAIDFDRADAYELLGRALEADGRRRDAEAAYGRALRLRPDSPAALNNLAGLFLERGACGRATRLLDRAIAAFPGLSTVWATLGALRLREGDLDAARRACEVALDIVPENRPALVNLALAHERAGRHGRGSEARRSTSEFRWAEPSAPGADSGTASVARNARLRTPLGPGGVISVIRALHGGAGRVLVDAVRALRGRRQLVLCLDPGDSTRQGLRQELRDRGVEIAIVASVEDVSRALGEVRPALVLHHWWGGDVPLEGPARSGSERWIAIGHAPLPMPVGYDRYVVMSAFHRQFQNHLPRARLHHIPNGVDLRRFRGAAGRHRRPVTIVMLTRLDPGKFPRQLLAFLPSLETLGARLLIAGRGARRYELEPEIARRGAPVRFVGPIATERVPAFLGQADIGLHLTETHQEICSMTILEMMAAGLPIVAEPKGCLTEMVVSHENGFLAEDPAEIAARLRELIRSPGLRRRLGAAGRRRARAYSMDRYRASMRALVEFAISERRSPARIRSSIRDPATISLSGWRPSLSYLICTISPESGALLGTALLGTGVAGMPEAYFGPDRLPPDIRGPLLAAFLAEVMEAGATPNGVFGALMIPGHLAALAEGLHGMTGGGSGGIAERMSSVFPNLHYVWVGAGESRLSRTAAAAWDGFFARCPRPLIRVRHTDLNRDPKRTARSVLLRLGLSAQGSR